MEKEFVPFELSLRLKNIGFDEPCLAGYYNDGKSLWFFRFHKNSERKPTVAERFATAVLYQQAFDWFREKHNLHGLNSPLLNNEWSVVIDNTLNSNQVYWNKVVGYQEARKACLEKLIEIVEHENIKTKYK